MATPDLTTERTHDAATLEAARRAVNGTTAPKSVTDSTRLAFAFAAAALMFVGLVALFIAGGDTRREEVAASDRPPHRRHTPGRPTHSAPGRKSPLIEGAGRLQSLIGRPRHRHRQLLIHPIHRAHLPDPAPFAFLFCRVVLSSAWVVPLCNE